MATITVSTSLNIEELHVILARVESETIKHDPDSLQSNPVLNAASALYNRLKAAAERVSLEGAAVLEAASDSVVQEWEALKASLGAKASELLALFQKQIGLLITDTMQSIAQAIPSSLNRTDGVLNLDSVAFKLALGLSPSVSVAATEWLKLVATAGAEVTLSYRR